MKNYSHFFVFILQSCSHAYMPAEQLTVSSSVQQLQ